MARYVCSAGRRISGFKSRTQRRKAISRLWVLKLKTNSVHGVLDCGSRENRSCGEAANPLFITPLAPTLTPNVSESSSAFPIFEPDKSRQAELHALSCA